MWLKKLLSPEPQLTFVDGYLGTEARLAKGETPEEIVTSHCGKGEDFYHSPYSQGVRRALTDHTFAQKVGVK
jgi:hypothetical protein